MIQVMRIPMAKTKLAALPKDERVLLFLLGYVSNQTMMLEKLMLFSGNWIAKFGSHPGPR